MADQPNDLNAKDFLIGMLVGGFVGAVTTLLLAPKAGDETRSDLNRQWVTVKGKTQEVSRTVKDKAVDVGQTVKEQASGVIDKLRESKESIAIDAKDSAGADDEVKAGESNE